MDIRDVVVELQNARQPWMNKRNVIPLEVIVHVDLPVARRLVNNPAVKLLFVDGAAFGPLPCPGKDLFNGVRWVFCEVDENQGLPRGQVDLCQFAVFPVKIGDIVKVGRTGKATIQCIGPAVIAALQHPPGTVGGGKGATPVAADVKKSPQFLVISADDDQGFAGDIGQKPIARVWGFGLVSDILPGPAKNKFPVQGVKFGVGVPRSGQGLGLFHGQDAARLGQDAFSCD